MRLNRNSTTSFSDLPNELVWEILLAAVKGRGIRRASRLRFVCRSWNAAVLEAIFASGILESEKDSHSYWPRYLAYMVLKGSGSFSRPLRIIRLVAERLESYRGGTDDSVRDRVLRICDIPHRRMALRMTHSDTPLNEDNAVWNIGDDDEQYKQALLAAAAGENEVDFVRTILPSFRDCRYLICPDGNGRPDFELIFGYPIHLAAFRGNNEIVKLLVEAIGENDIAPGQILQFAAAGNRLSPVEFAIKMGRCNNESLLAGIQDTKSVEIFDLLLPITRDCIELEGRGKPNYCERQFLPRKLVEAARDGNVAMMDHLFDLGTRLTAHLCESYSSPVLQAARHGRRNTLTRLLDRGVYLHPSTLEAAARYGDPGTVRIVLSHTDQITCSTQPLIAAVEGENEVVVKILLSAGADDLDEGMATASRRAYELGFESMVKLLSQLDTHTSAI
ncbi:hypothetical protein F4778DRAFT_731445 [Xylariomycetidae sp. FL2044]|nr:hypothetical protein F4778DRAFT_731445 [Xylariomycetidae sp. FL2044]